MENVVLNNDVKAFLQLIYIQFTWYSLSGFDVDSISLWILNSNEYEKLNILPRTYFIAKRKKSILN